MGAQQSIFDGSKPFIINKKVRLIELFAGIGAQAKAFKTLKRLFDKVEFEHYRACEYNQFSIKSYNAIHETNYKKSDIREWTAVDLGIVSRDLITYFMTYSFPCQDLSLAGKRKGMTKGQQTRSGLLWEVERVRKLTERECWRLMMFEDSDFDKAKAAGISKTQLYFQAGNSIVVSVLVAIIAKMYGIEFKE